MSGPRYSAIDIASELKMTDDMIGADWQQDGPDTILRLSNGQVFRVEVTELTEGTEP